MSWTISRRLSARICLRSVSVSTLPTAQPTTRTTISTQSSARRTLRWLPQIILSLRRDTTMQQIITSRTTPMLLSLRDCQRVSIVQLTEMLLLRGDLSQHRRRALVRSSAVHILSLLRQLSSRSLQSISRSVSRLYRQRMRLPASVRL